MAAPVGNRQLPATSPASQEVVGAASPQGVGSAPTTLQSAEEQNSEPPPQKGYVERFVLFIRDWVVWLFSKIFFCCNKSESPAQQGPQNDQTAPGQAPIPDPEFHVSDAVRSDIELLNAFHRLRRGDGDENVAQTRIYQLIGREERARRWLPTLKSNKTLGREAVQRDPQVLRAHLIRPN